MQQMELVLKEIKEEAPDVSSFLFEPKTPFSWKAGQFMIYELPHENPDDRGIKRYFTIASAAHEGHVRLTARFAQNGSTFKKALKNLKAGDIISVQGPGGHFVLEDPMQEYIFIAGGIGITPFRAILLDLGHKNLPMNIKLLYGNRDEHIVFQKELEAIAKKHDTFSIHYFISNQKIDEQAIRKYAPDIAKPLFYTSGPEPMVRAFETMLSGLGVPKEHSKRDYFPGYETI